MPKLLLQQIKNHNNMKKVIIIAGIATLTYACSGVGDNTASNDPEASASKDLFEKKAPDPEHEKKGIGKFTHVELSPTLDAAMASKGQNVYDLKCVSCHRLTGEKLVGPGWKGVTTRRTAEWVMNFSTNTDEMLNEDAAAMAMLEECLVRMPNQNLADDDARAVYEFMRKNDGVK
jgi:mono/diheme cytochrome c family protein